MTAKSLWIFMERQSEWLCHTLFDRLPKELLALEKRLSRSLLTVASVEMMLPRQVKCSTELRLVPLIPIWVDNTFCRGGWCNIFVFFRLMVRPKFLAASEKWLTMYCRASSMWTKRAQSSVSSCSVMSSSMVFVRAKRCQRLNRLLSVWKWM